MKNLLKSMILASLLLTQVASADPYLYHHTQATYQIVYELPSGESKTIEADPNSTGLGDCHLYGMPNSVPTVPTEVKDDLGTTLWKGTLKNNRSYLILPVAGGKVEMVEAGFYGGDNSVKAAIIADLSGQNFKVDFFGTNGLDGQKGLTFDSTFNKQKAFRFHAKEENYKLKLTDAAGNTFEPEWKIKQGKYYVIFKNKKGKYNIAPLGHIKK